MRWAEHVEGMREEKKMCRVWLDGIRMNLREIGWRVKSGSAGGGLL
jgi:hypothetical protein